MMNRQILKGHRNIFASIGIAGLLLFILCMLLTGCDGHFLSIDCIGSSGYCGPLPAPPHAPFALLATATAITRSKPLVTDPLSKQDSFHWAVDSACNFHNGAYYVKFSNRSGGTYTCDSNKLNYRNVAIAMDVTLISGDSAGILFRASPDMNNFYEFMVSRGQFVLVKFVNNNSSLVIPAIPSGVIHDLNHANRLLVIARGDDFQLFINGTFVGEAHDDSLAASGYVGVSLVYTPKGEASFSNLVIYQV